MTWTRLIVMLCAAACIGSVWAEDRPVADPPTVDLTKIDRTIAKEPKYANVPRYALLAFGTRADLKVWLVVDGDKLYVDRDGDGDLTDPDEAISNSGQYSPTFVVDSLKSRSGAEYSNLRVTKYQSDFNLTVNVVGKGVQTLRPNAGRRPDFAATAKEAPIVHLDGPLTIAQYKEDRVISRSEQSLRNTDRRRALRIVLGTQGVGSGTFAVFHCKVCDQHGSLQAEYEYPTAGGSSVTQTDALLKVG